LARTPPSPAPLIEDLTAAAGERLRPPVAIVLGTPHEVAELAVDLPGEVVCYQMDLFPADQLRDEISNFGAQARVETVPDLWDLPAEFRTVVYPAPRGGERGLKVDMVEQAFHILQPHGSLIVHSPYEDDQFFPAQLKKVFGKVHSPVVSSGRVFWTLRHGDRPRRRHEVTYHARVGPEPALTFVSRPGTFAYGRFDDGARALVETMEIQPGDRILDAGCGCGTNGVFAGKLAGPEGHLVFVDSNVRAVALAEQNARSNDLTRFEAHAAHTLETLPRRSFDVMLANPPYFAQQSIARQFIERGRELLKRGGRFYLVTKQPDAVGPMIAETFGRADVTMRRGYTILIAEAT
jgi:16S rRNA (guanine1207-N2)-methyltransferase